MLLFRDGFDKYTAGGDLAYRWTINTGGPTILTTGGVTGAQAIRQGGTSEIDARFFSNGTLTSGGTIHFAVWAKCTLFPDAGNPIGIMWLATNVQSFSGTGTPSGNVPHLGIENDGTIHVTTQHGASATTGSPPRTMILNQWHHIEYSAKYADAGGFIKVWVDRQLVIDISGDTLVGTQPSSVTHFSLRNRVGVGNQLSMDYDDLVVWDEAGANFDFTQIAATKEHVIETLDVDADDAVQFTPSAGSNFQNVDEVQKDDGDTTYNESDTPGDTDLFTFEAQANTPLQTFGITITAVGRKVDLGGVGILVRMDSGGAERDTEVFTLTETYLQYQVVEDAGLDPDTGLPWTNTAVNSLKGGYKYETGF